MKKLLLLISVVGLLAFPAAGAAQSGQADFLPTDPGGSAGDCSIDQYGHTILGWGWGWYLSSRTLSYHYGYRTCGQPSFMGGRYVWVWLG